MEGTFDLRRERGGLATWAHTEVRANARVPKNHTQLCRRQHSRQVDSSFRLFVVV